MFRGTGAQQNPVGTSGQVTNCHLSPKCHPGQRKGQGPALLGPSALLQPGRAGARLGLAGHDTGKAFSAPNKASPEVGELQLPAKARGGRGKKRNKELLVLKEIPAGGGGPELLCALGEVSTKAAGAPPALWVNGCHQGHLGRRQSCLRRVVF